MNIIARKPRENDVEYIVVDRGHGAAPFVVASATAHSLASGEWFWGHYFTTREAALTYFNGLS